MLPVSLGCTFVIVPSVFSNVYLDCNPHFDGVWGCLHPILKEEERLVIPTSLMKCYTVLVLHPRGECSVFVKRSTMRFDGEYVSTCIKSIDGIVIQDIVNRHLHNT